MSHEDQPTEPTDGAGQARDAHAPEATGWSPEAAASICAAAHRAQRGALDIDRFLASQRGKPYRPDPDMGQAAAELAAHAADLAAAHRGNDATSAISGAGERWEALERRDGARERRGVVASHVVEDCARRVAAWAATLPTPEQRRTALDAADVVRQGR